MPRSKNAAKNKNSSGTNFKIEFKNDAQGLAWAAFQEHDVLFLIGPAGSGKSFLACAFAIEQILSNKKRKLVLTRPVVEAGEYLGYLPGGLEDKLDPYMMPMWDCIDKLVGREGLFHDKIQDVIEVAPLAFMRGRALCNNTKIYTPDGFKLMGEIKVGDQVIGSDGKSTKVTGVYPQGKIQTYEIGFSDGTKIICCEDHLWSTMTLSEKRHNKGFTTKSTKEIMKNVLNNHNQKVHRVPLLSGPVQFEEREVKVDPYLLGCLLGDGNFTHDTVKLTSNDFNIIEECSKRLPVMNELIYRSKYEYAIKLNGNSNLKEELKSMELMGLKSHLKFIPDDYKYNSSKVRLEILQGLLDTDGWICSHRSGNCRIQFCSASKRLAEDVMFLVRSLGGRAYFRKREYTDKDSHKYKGKTIRHVHPSYIVDIKLGVNPFKLKRKAEKYKSDFNMTKMISYVTPMDTRECTCIKVDAKDSLFLIEGFNITHNTFDNSVCIFDEAQNATFAQLKLFLTRFGENSKIIITGDPKQSDLGGPVALVEVMKRVRDLDGIGILEFKSNSIVRHPLVGKIIEKLEE